MTGFVATLGGEKLNGGDDVDSLAFESWEKLGHEGARAFAAFCAYRDFGCERISRKLF